MTFAEKIRQNKQLLKEEQKLFDFYIEVYNNCFPQANFETLVKKAKLENGFYDIKRDNFIIANKKLKEIEKKFKLKHYNRINCSVPKIIYDEC